MPYLFGGIALDTDLEFLQLENLGERIPRLRLTLRRTAVPAAAEDVVHRSDGRYRLSMGIAAAETGSGDRNGQNGCTRDWVFRSRFPDAFTFSAAHRRIDCHIGSADDQPWHDVLFRRVIPRIATTYGAMAIHAAAIAIDDRCLLLLGPSGAGKSTLTAFCATMGWHVLSDDITIAWHDEQVMVEPVQQGMGLWDEVCDALSLPADRLVPMPGYENRKWCFVPPHAPSSKPRVLSAILMLERCRDAATPGLARMSQQEALRTLTPQNIPFLLEDRPSAATATSFGRIAALSRAVPAYRLTYPHGYEMLPRTEALLRHMPVETPTETGAA